METCQLFWEQSCQVQKKLAQKMRLKKCSFWVQLKSWQFCSVASKRKIAGNPHRIDRHRSKIGLNPNFLGYSSSP